MLNIFGIGIVTIFAVTATFATTITSPKDDLVDGVLIQREYINGLLTVDMAADKELVCPSNARGNLCADDCKTLLACSSSSSKPLYAGQCSDFSSVAHYCIPGKTGCSIAGDSKYKECAAAKISSFPCTDVGYFPNPTNCTLYHVCTEEVSETYQCPPRYVFDSINIKCKRRRNSRDCRKINCAASANKYVVYPGNKAHYAYCSSNGPIMFRCGDMDNFEFNPSSVNCEFVCKGEGWYPNYQNCQDYYECYRGTRSINGRKLISRLQSCPINMMFNVTSRRCVKGECSTTMMPTSTTELTTSVSSSSEITTTGSTISSVESSTSDLTSSDGSTTDPSTPTTTVA